jgi:hypothetical protein
LTRQVGGQIEDIAGDAEIAVLYNAPSRLAAPMNSFREMAISRAMGMHHKMPYMSPRLVILLVLALLLATDVGQVSAQQSDARVALVIANAAYPDADAPLKDTVNSARTLADDLRRQGFEVDIGENLTKQAMRAALDRFYGKIKSNSTALFFSAASAFSRTVKPI